MSTGLLVACFIVVGHIYDTRYMQHELNQDFVSHYMYVQDTIISVTICI